MTAEVRGPLVGPEGPEGDPGTPGPPGPAVPVDPLTFAAIADPAAPAADHLAVYAKKVAGRMMPKAKAPSGVSYALQCSFFQQIVYLIITNTAGSSTSFGCTQTLVGTGNSGTTEDLGIRTKASTAAAIGSNAGVNSNSNLVRRGTVANGSNGFFFAGRWALDDASYELARLFVGMTNGTYAGMVTVDQPTGNHVGFHRLPGDATWFVTRGSGAAGGRVDTGMPFVPGHLYDGYLYTPPGAAADIDDLTAGTTAEGSITGALLPTAGTTMKFGCAVGAIDAAVHSISFSRFYVEADR